MSNTNNFTKINNIDLESNEQIINGEITINNLTNPNNSTNTIGCYCQCYFDCKNFCYRTYIFLILLMFISPFIICELYYAYNDTSCIYQKIEQLHMNLHDFLMISGYMGISVSTIYGVIIYTQDNNTLNLLYKMFISNGGINTNNEKPINVYLAKLFYFVICFFGMFGLSWLILGSLIFWKFMDTSKCSNSIYNYIYAELIIRWIIIFGSFIVRLCS